MRILFFSSVFPRPANQSHGVYSLNWCKAWAAAGHSVHVFSPRGWLEDSGGRTGNLGGIPAEYPRYFYTPRFFRSAYGDFMWASVGRKLRRTISEFRPHCIISYWIHPDGEVAVRAAREARIPSAVIVGGSDALILPRQGRSRRRRIVGVLRSTDAVVTVSRHLRDEVIQLGAPADMVHVVYQGVDRDLFCPGDKTSARRRLGIEATPLSLLFVGNLVPVKGIDVLLEACALVRERGHDFRLYLIGNGPSRSSLEAKASALGLTNRVFFIGSVAQTSLPNWYRAADLTVLASHSEGIPNVLRESMACGTPIVATHVGGIHEIASGPGNLLVPPRDPVALARAIEQSLKMQLAPQLPIAGVGSWADSAEQLLNVLKPLVSADAQSENARRVSQPVGAGLGAAS